MKIISVEQYEFNSMQLAKPIFDKNRRILLNKGKTIDPRILQKIKEMGISYIFVEDKESQGISLNEVMDMSTWMNAIHEMESIFFHMKKKGYVDAAPVQKLANRLISEVQGQSLIILIPSTAVPHEQQDYAHAVNVTLLSLQMAKLHYNQMQLKDLAIGCLLHDIGKLFTEEEKEHPKFGFEAIRKVREFSIISAHISLQHHEHKNGRGFPRGVNEVHPLAQICGVANCYENLISKDRIPPHEAMEIIMAKSDSAYDVHIIESFVQNIPSYIPGTKVELNNGEVAIVKEIKTHLHRPLVRQLSNNEEICLASNPTVLITKVFYELNSLEK